jgi:hypothetical protein
MLQLLQKSKRRRRRGWWRWRHHIVLLSSPFGLYNIIEAPALIGTPLSIETGLLRWLLRDRRRHASRNHRPRRRLVNRGG